jgi:hypothetical protein
VSYGYRKLDRLLNQEFWTDLTFPDKSGFWRNFSMTSPETSYIKDVDNELIFLLVSHTTYFNIWFGCYVFLKSGFTAGQFLDRLVMQVIGQVFGPQDEWNSLRFENMI